MKLHAVALLLCSLIFIQSSAQTPAASRKESSPVLFRVNKQTVTADEFIYLYKKNHQNPEQDYTREKIEEYLALYINFKLKVAEARRRGMDTTASFRKEFNQYKDELRKPYMPGNGLADSLARMAYERMKEEVRAAHLLISVAADAPPEDTLRVYNRIVDLRNRINAGESFEKIAAEHSEDPSAKMNNGDLGYFSAFQMVYPFENAAYNTPVGTISDPVRTRFGYHLLKIYDRRPASPEIEVSHIMIRTGDENSDQDSKDRIFSIYDQLAAGVAWADLCRQHSDDAATRQNGGKLRPFRKGMMSNVPEFQTAAFELSRPGQYSDPVRTQYGWHIIKLERIIPLGTYDEMAASLKTRVSRDERTRISKEAQQTRLKKDLGFRENEATKSELLSIPDSLLKNGAWKKNLTGKQQSSVLFELGSSRFTVAELLRWVDNVASPAPLQTHYGNFIDQSVLDLQEQNIIRNNPEYKFLMNEYYEGILLFEIMEKEVWNKASSDSVGQYRYFEDNAANYTAGPRLRASLYSSEDASQIQSLKERIETETDERALQEYLNTNKIRMESGYYEKEDKAVLQRFPWEPGIHQTENNGLYYLALVKEVLPAGRMSFEEARPELISDYQNFLEEQWLADLRKKYPLRIDKKGKAYTLSTLEKK